MYNLSYGNSYEVLSSRTFYKNIKLRMGIWVAKNNVKRYHRKFEVFPVKISYGKWFGLLEIKWKSWLDEYKIIFSKNETYYVKCCISNR